MSYSGGKYLLSMWKEEQHCVNVPKSAIGRVLNDNAPHTGVDTYRGRYIQG